MRKSIENLLQQELTRKEFIQYLGSGLMVLFGISSLLKAIQAPLQRKDRSISGGSNYGSQAYGGKEK
jgi:hypothetical protein